MPIHIDAISRRQFLRRGALAGAGFLSLRSKVFAADSAESHWALLSDTHIAANPDHVLRDVNMGKNLHSVVGEVTALKDKLAGIFINGDCALSEGLQGDYTTFTSFIAPFVERKNSIHMTLGNHDNRSNFLNAFESERALAKPVESKHVSLVESENVNWVLLDSLDVTNKTPGKLDQPQRDWLAKLLDAHASKNTIVMVHHNPNMTPEKKTGIADTAELFEILLPRRHVKALMFGHSHRWEISKRDDLHLINLPATAYVFSKEQPSGWVDCHIAATGATLELRSLNADHPAHGKKTELTWRT